MLKLLLMLAMIILIANSKDTLRPILERGEVSDVNQNETTQHNHTNLPSATASEKCKDLDTDCFHFSQQGECTKNPKWMLENCKVSCSNCGGTCEDYHHLCIIWKRSGECNVNPNFMHIHCPKSCGTCSKVLKNASAHINGGEL